MQKKSVEKKLYRSKKNRVIAGIAGGLGEYFDIDPVLVRVVFLGVTVLGGAGVLVYLLMWLIIPSEGSSGRPLEKDTIEENVKEVSGTAMAYAEEFQKKSKESSGSSGKFGWLLIIFGAFLLVVNQGWLGMIDWGRFWPLVIIGAGVYFLAR